MADLLTHLATALVPAAVVPHRAGPLVALGTLWPDITSRVIPLGLEQLNRWVPLPEPVFWPWGALHEPLGIAASCAVLAGLFRQQDRLMAYASLCIGGSLHLAVDLLQDHHGAGYYLLFPISNQRIELGWIGSEATVELAPVFIGLAAMAWAWRAWSGGFPLTKAKAPAQTEKPAHSQLSD